jgi:LytS/YehU family sensor histidine kinase
MGLFYLNVSVLMPHLFYKKKYNVYIAALLSSFFIIMLIHGLLFKPIVPGHEFNFIRSSAHNIVPFLFTVLISTVYNLVAQKIKEDVLSAKVQQENLKSELSFLRSQINPHFLFNVLNNIAALVRIKSNELEPTVMKLSSLMHYMLYETDEDKVVVKSEVEYLQAYIDLQKQRHGDELTLLVLFDIKEEWHTVEPMLLIPFVENAFKHGGALMQRPEIYIRLEVDNNQLHFVVKNKFEDNKTAKDKTSGIGLTNVKRRLTLLYPGKHNLSIEKKDDWFIVHLQLTLK